MEILESIWEAAGPLILFLEILLALCVGGLIWLWMILPGNRKGALDNGDVFPDPHAVAGDVLEYETQRLLYIEDSGLAPDELLLQHKRPRGPI